MKKFPLVIFSCFISVSVFAADFHRVPENFQNTDFRDKLWYYGTGAMGDVDEFLNKFAYLHIERTIAKDRFAGLMEPYYSICEKLLNRGRGVAIPKNTFNFMIICDTQYGVMLFWWDDISSFGGDEPQMRLMFRHFFELKSVQ